MKTILLTLVFLFSTLMVNASTGKKVESVENLGRDVYVWGYPMVLLSHARKAMLEKTSSGKQSMNHFFHGHRAPDPFLGHFISVNPENLYSWAWVDLIKEPLVMTHPKIAGRFYSIQFIDAYSNVFQTVSSNSHGNKPGVFLIIPPGWKGKVPANMTPISASTPEIFILAQTYVKSAKEAPTVAKLTSQRHLIPLSKWNSGIKEDKFTNNYPSSLVKINKNLATYGYKFMKDLRELVSKNPPATRAEVAEAERFFPLGLFSQREFEKLLSDFEMKKLFERGLFEGEREIQARLAIGTGPKVNGWSYELKAPAFTVNYLLRAAASQKYLFSPPSAETLQLALEADSEGRQLSSSYRYMLHFDADLLPPANEMWSLQIYELKSRNADRLVRPISSINNKSAKLKYNMDGSVDILIQNERPREEYVSNWLPLSKNSNFYVVLTLFNPSETVLNTRYAAPSLGRIDESDSPKQRVTHTMMASWEGPVSK